MWCVPAIDQQFVDRMEDVLALYARQDSRAEPVVCIDERPVQLLAPARAGVPMRPGQPARTDFCIIEPITGRRLTYASTNRRGPAFASALWRIARRYHRARKIHLVLDNLSTHSERCVVEALGAGGRRLSRRFVLHYTPKHASWLNAAEMEASLVSRECIGKRRIGHFHTLRSQVAAWRRRAEHDRRPIRWRFSISDARRVFRYSGIITPRTRH